MFRRAWVSLRNAVNAAAQTKKLVGSDLQGNKYYTIFDDENKLKRAVEYKSGTWDPTGLPQLWSLWLHHQRETPPTRQEELDIAEYQRVVQSNVKRLEQADTELRKQELEKGEHKENKSYSPDQFFVTWRKKIQQEDGSIDVDTNKKKYESSSLLHSSARGNLRWIQVIYPRSMMHANNAGKDHKMQRLSTTEPGRICGRCNAALIYEIHCHCIQCARVFGSCPWCGAMPYMVGP